jgi:hypothetical protein
MIKKTLFLLISLILACSTNKNTTQPNKDHKTKLENKKVKTEKKVFKGCGKRVIKIYNAEINPFNNRSTWDKKKKVSLAKFVIWGASVILGLPEVAGVWLVNAVAENSQSTGEHTNPDPFIILKYQSSKYMVPIHYNTLNPAWDYPVIINLDNPNEELSMKIYDADTEGKEKNKDILGSNLLDIRKLCQNRKINIKSMQNVKNITIRSTPYEEKTKVYKKIKVDAKKDNKTEIKVIAGQSLKILKIDGKVCASGKKCVYSRGFPLPQWEKYNIVKNANHCSLIVKVGKYGKWIHAKIGEKIKVQSSGVLYFGVNDDDKKNNSGHFIVNLVVK